MTLSELQIILIASIVSIASALPGVFLLLRKTSLMSDAISHSVLLGIVLAFFITKNLSSPFLIIGAVLSGFLMVTITEWFIHTKKVKKDAAIGIVFPLFFSIAVILINQKVSNIHLDSDAVLLGSLELAPSNHLYVGDYDLGPHAFWVMGSILLLNAIFIFLFYKELKISTFDPEFSEISGFSPRKMHYALMLLTTITVVGAFDCVGSILVVALMIAIPAAACLLSKSVTEMIVQSIRISILSSLCGYSIAFPLNGSIAGAIATSAGAIFFLALFFSPYQGLFVQYMKKKIQKSRENRLIKT